MCLFRFGFLVFDYLFLFFVLSAKIPLFIKQVQEARRFFYQGWERLGCVSQMDEEQLSSWP